MYNKKIDKFQGQVEMVLKETLSDIDLTFAQLLGDAGPGCCGDGPQWRLDGLYPCVWKNDTQNQGDNIPGD